MSEIEEMANTKLVRNDTHLRAEELLNLGIQCFNDGLPDHIYDVIKMGGEEIWAAIGKGGPDTSDMDAIIEHLWVNGVYGFLVQFATPNPTKFIGGGYATMGWGMYTTGWVYAETLEEACGKGIAWKKAYIEEERILASQPQ